MPRKYRMETQPQGPAILDVEYFSSTLEEWHPDCDRDPSYIEYNTSVYHAAENAADERVTSYEEIVYENTQKSRMTTCSHVAKKMNLGEDIPLFVEQNSYDDEERPYNGCGHNDWIHRVQVIREKLHFTPGSFLVPSGSITADLSTYGPGPLSPVCLSIMGDYRAYALSDLIPRLDTGFSLPVFLAELRDIPRMVFGLLNLIKSLSKSVLRALRNCRLKDLSSGWLSAIYGWIPFLSDIRRILKLLVTAREKSRKFVKEAGIRRTLYWKREVTPELYYEPEFFESSEAVQLIAGHPGTPLYEFRDYIDSFSGTYKRNFTFDKLIYHATLDFQYNIPLVGMFTEALASMDQFGVNLSVSDIWEIVPFSFVIDWFVDISSFLKGFDLVNLPVEVVIYDFCDSLKSELACTSKFEDVEILFPSIPDMQTSTPVFSSRYSEKSYYRWRGYPFSPTVDYQLFGLPHGWQIVNGLALVGQRT